MSKNNSSSDSFNVMFIITSMPVGGAEMLLVNMIRRMDHDRCRPVICCMKEKDVLGELMVEEGVDVYSDLIRHRYDVGVVGRIRSLIQKHNIDAVITIGAGDKMFWGRLAAKRARVPVILSALHSTGWPDGVGRMNRMLTPITDGFIAVAENHGKFLVEQEKFPAHKVFVIPNGVDAGKFVQNPQARNQWRNQMGIAGDAPAVGIVAALRPEKNHKLFLTVASKVLQSKPDAQFVIAGDGPIRGELESFASELNISKNVHFLGSVSDVPGVLASLDLFALTSDNEASPVSILEAMSCSLPVVATDVGSVSQSVIEGRNGFLYPTNNADAAAEAWLKVLELEDIGKAMGAKGREHVLNYASLQKMTDSYVELISGLYQRKVLNRPDTDQLKSLSVLYPANALSELQSR